MSCSQVFNARKANQRGGETFVGLWLSADLMVLFALFRTGTILQFFCPDESVLLDQNDSLCAFVRDDSVLAFSFTFFTTIGRLFAQLVFQETNRSVLVRLQRVHGIGAGGVISSSGRLAPPASPLSPGWTLSSAADVSMALLLPPSPAASSSSSRRLSWDVDAPPGGLNEPLMSSSESGET